MFFCPAVPYVVPTKMIDVIYHLGLQSGLKLCLDAGDADSYTSGQKWLDRSGGGYDFFRGSGSGSDSADPTFNGVAGGQSQSEYWSFDGADFFTYDAANETWMNNIHKNNARFAMAMWFYLGSVAGANDLMGTNGGASEHVGFAILTGTSSLGFYVSNANGLPDSPALLATFPGTTAGAWRFYGVSVDEASGVGFSQVQGAQGDFVATYASPSAANATRQMQVGGSGLNGTYPDPMSNGSRFASVAIWESTGPTKEQMLALYNATKGQFGF